MKNRTTPINRSASQVLWNCITFAWYICSNKMVKKSNSHFYQVLVCSHSFYISPEFYVCFCIERIKKYIFLDHINLFPLTNGCVPKTCGDYLKGSIKLRKTCLQKKEGKASYQSCKRIVRSSRYIVLDKKSIPMVACNYQKGVSRECN